MKITNYKIKSEKPIKTRISVAADVHGCNIDEILDGIARSKPDIITIPGDLVGKHDAEDRTEEFLTRAVKIAPTFLSIGNHERKCGIDRDAVKRSGAVLLDDEFTVFEDFAIGGLSSGFGEEGQSNFKKTPIPDTSWLNDFCFHSGYRILMSHHPEYYDEFLKGLSCDLILSGHAHGGQWRIFGRGIFAPGQGLFPKYTSGIYDGRLIVSRGLCNHTSVPRIFNPIELLNIDVNL